MTDSRVEPNHLAVVWYLDAACSDDQLRDEAQMWARELLAAGWNGAADRIVNLTEALVDTRDAELRTAAKAVLDASHYPGYETEHDRRVAEGVALRNLESTIRRADGENLLGEARALDRVCTDESANDEPDVGLIDGDDFGE